jgi:Na+-translocating ferredoxin:NAD+ oxidoreductase RnfD subunit
MKKKQHKPETGLIAFGITMGVLLSFLVDITVTQTTDAGNFFALLIVVISAPIYDHYYNPELEKPKEKDVDEYV